SWSVPPQYFLNKFSPECVAGLDKWFIANMRNPLLYTVEISENREKVNVGTANHRTGCSESEHPGRGPKRGHRPSLCVKIWLCFAMIAASGTA
ncbi:MAG: hypothetical protein WBZ37_22885, partial [Mycobacterium sp.]